VALNIEKLHVLNVVQRWLEFDRESDIESRAREDRYGIKFLILTLITVNS
jgi:hypothetical protein